MGGRLASLGADGFGRSDSRKTLRHHNFEIDAEHVAYRVLVELSRNGRVPNASHKKAIAERGIDPDVPHPATA